MNVETADAIRGPQRDIMTRSDSRFPTFFLSFFNEKKKMEKSNQNNTEKCICCVRGAGG